MPARLIKTCIGPCGRELPIEWFHKNANYRDGRMSRCKDCINNRRRRPGAVARDAHRPDGTRRCFKCRIFKAKDAYTSGRDYVCDLCRPAYNREIWYRHEYGLDYAVFQAMFDEQNGRCAICREEMETPHLDHCHATKKIRGLLCPRCNLAVGLLKDDPVRMGAMLLYVGNPRAS